MSGFGMRALGHRPVVAASPLCAPAFAGWLPMSCQLQAWVCWKPRGDLSARIERKTDAAMRQSKITSSQGCLLH